MTSEPTAPESSDEDYPARTATLSSEAPEAPAPPPPPPRLDFDLTGSPIPSFHSLQEARSSVFRRRQHVESFRQQVEALPKDGDAGRRKGLGLWMLGRFKEAAAQLASYESDDVASFTRAHALMSAGDPKAASPVFERLSKAYPGEPRPRGGWIAAQLEADLLSGDDERARSNLKDALSKAPQGFDASAEGRYLQGRAAELERDWETALDHFDAARKLDPTHRAALFHGAHLAERCGLDEEALDCYESLVRLIPIDKTVLYNLGVLYEDFGRDTEAAACYDTIVRTYPTDRRARLYLQDARSAMDMFYDEDLERKEDRLNQILRTPITDFELSVRARNCLNKMNIVTLGDLVRQTEQELLAYKNFGETSLNEIKEILASKNLRLGLAHEEAVASIEAATRPRATGENAEVLNKPVSDLDLSIRARRTVENLGCLTIGDILQHSEDELLSMPNFGVTSLQELKRKLTEFGQKLADKK
jgi:DNA-directed RNA polymerase subunit alpha